VFTAVMLPLGVLNARRPRVKRHRNTMIGLFLGALIVAGIVTLARGRILHEVGCCDQAPSQNAKN
jgi:uncharacterized membrane protein